MRAGLGVGGRRAGQVPHSGAVHRATCWCIRRLGSTPAPLHHGTKHDKRIKKRRLGNACRIQQSMQGPVSCDFNAARRFTTAIQVAVHAWVCIQRVHVNECTCSVGWDAGAWAAAHERRSRSPDSAGAGHHRGRCECGRSDRGSAAPASTGRRRCGAPESTCPMFSGAHAVAERLTDLISLPRKTVAHLL